MADSSTFDVLATDNSPEALRERAVRRIKEKNDFKIHLVVYLTINTMLVTLWAVTSNYFTAPPGAPLEFFWPIFPIIGWGIGVVIHGYTAYPGNVYSESQIQREMQRLSR